ncbi:MAG TPA: two-component regulator propeller domain-containing protein, partial [Chryseolinea sp.]|nr:two-component regulator propeller domain-containing protein [Chryseolinea sp.]
LTANAGSLMVALPSGLWELNEANEISSIASDIIDDPRQAVVDDAGDIWVGDGSNGLVSDAKGSFEAFLPNCPVNNETFKLSYQQGIMYSLPGGYSNEGLALHRPGIIDIFQEGTWTSTLAVNQDITDIQVVTSTETILSSFGNGLEIHANESEVIVLNETNSPLINANPPQRSVNVTSMANSGGGVWVANYASNKPLHLLKEDHMWESFSFPISSAQYPLEMVVDLSDNVWLLLDPAQGGGLIVFNKEDNAFRYLSDVAGQGGLPSKSAYSIAVDRDGFVWVGTALGAAYFNNSTGIFNGSADAIRPIVDGRFLLRDDKVTSIAVDGGNRKWFGTDRGVWLYGPEGEEVIENFTTVNSPLPSDTVRDIEINDESGEVFFATDEGLASFRSGATRSGTSQSVKVFPNPVTSSFVGTVGISGTPQDAIVKITDITGKLVFQTKASGGTALWQVQDNKGRRVSTGIYIVFVVTPDGEERLASKIAVVD